MKHRNEPSRDVKLVYVLAAGAWVAGAVVTHRLGALDWFTGSMFGVGLAYTIGLRPEIASALRAAPALVMRRLGSRTDKRLPPGDG